MNRPSLTARQAQVFHLIADSIERKGYPPSHRELADALGVASMNGVNGHLRALERKGWIKRTARHARAIQLVPLT